MAIQDKIPTYVWEWDRRSRKRFVERGEEIEKMPSLEDVREAMKGISLEDIFVAMKEERETDRATESSGDDDGQPYVVRDYNAGATAAPLGVPTRELVDASLDAEPTGAVGAYLDGGNWHHAPEGTESLLTLQGHNVRTVYVSEESSGDAPKPKPRARKDGTRGT